MRRITKKRKLELIFLGALFLISLLTRVGLLSQYPPGFHFDEANAGYNAYSLLRTGKTIWSDSWPVYLNTFGDYRPMGIVYLIMPAVALLGLTEVAVRLPIAIVGAITPVLLYILAKRMSQEKPVAVLSSLFLALSFWHINLSRATSEAILALFFAILILLLFWSLLEKGGLKQIALIYILLVASFITYHPINLFLPLFLIILTIKFRRKFSQRPRVKKLLIGMIIAYLIFPQLTGVVLGEATGRLKQVAEIYSHEFQDHLLRQIVEHGNQAPIFLVRALHNKVINAGLGMTLRYADYLSPRFLLFEGGLPHRYLIPDVGLVNILELVGLVVFVVISLKYLRKSAVFTMTCWLLLGILPAAITTDDHPNLSRAVLMMPAIQFLAAFALVQVSRALRRKRKYYIAVALLILTGAWHAGYFLDQYVVHQRHHEWLHRNYAARNIAKELMRIDKDKKVLSTTYFLDTDVFVLFFQRIDPKIAQLAYKSGNRDQVSFLNYTFTNAHECATKLDVSEVPIYDVYVDLDYCDEPDWAKVTPLFNADGSIGAKILEPKISRRKID